MCVHAVLEPLGLAALAPGRQVQGPGLGFDARPGAHADEAGPPSVAVQGARQPMPASEAASSSGLGLGLGLELCKGLAPAERMALVEAAALPELLEGAAWRAVNAELARSGVPQPYIQALDNLVLALLTLPC